MIVERKIDRGAFTEIREVEVELTKEDIEYFIRTNDNLPEFVSMSIEDWEAYLLENVKTFKEELAELHEDEINNMEI